MHAGIAKERFPWKSVAGKTFPAFQAHNIFQAQNILPLALTRYAPWSKGDGRNLIIIGLHGAVNFALTDSGAMVQTLNLTRVLNLCSCHNCQLSRGLRKELATSHKQYPPKSHLSCLMPASVADILLITLRSYSVLDILMPSIIIIVQMNSQTLNTYKCL